MSNLNVTVTVQEGKNETRKLTSFIIGQSVVKSDLSELNKDARQDRIREIAKRFLTAEQQKLNYLCTVTDDSPAKKDKAAVVEAPTETQEDNNNA